MTYEQFSNQFDIHLNPQQSEAVRSIDGPVLLLAVPGSGKTTVLVTRLGYMIYCGQIAPEKILTVTYTVAAARDMAGRFCALFGNELKGRLEFRTINGICAKVIQYYGNLIGKAPFSLTTDSEMPAKLLADIFRRTEESYATESDLQGIRRAITYIKNSMLTDEEIERMDEEAGCKLSEIYKAYCGELRARSLIDYDDQMVYACRILKKSPEVLRHFQNKYTYICVDEAQDTSRIQHEIIRLLAGGRDNLFLVGDEDQSIYGFRAAYPEALLSFEKDHPGAKVLLMEENFRSDAKIVEAADRFIQRNTLRHEKHMKAARDGNAGIRKIVLKDRNAQYSHLAELAGECRVQTAVLYRNNESALPLVDLLERKGIPYRVRNAELAFFTHRTMQDIRNIILFAMNPKDTDLFLQIYYKVSTYINKQEAVRICGISRQENREVLETAIRYGQLPDRTKESCKLISTHLQCMLSERAGAAVNRILYYMGYKDYMDRMGMDDGRIFILKSIAQNEASPQRILERLDELQAIMSRKQDRQAERRPESRDEQQQIQPIILSTIHSSKGLEYDTVYLLDIVDGVFPENVPKSIAAMDRKEREAHEEERRLFYVGVTRAKNNLFVFKLDQKSSFCEELTHQGRPEACGLRDVRQRSGGRGRGGKAGSAAPLYAVKKKAFSAEEFEKFVAAIGIGLIVSHKKLGEGTVVEVERDRVMIQFEDGARTFGLKALYEYDLLAF